MVVNNDHYINEVLHSPGDHELTVDRFDTDYVLVAARILVDPNDPADLDVVHALRTRSAYSARSARPFVMPDYDRPASTRRARRCSPWREASTPSPAHSAARTMSTRSSTCLEPPRGGVACPNRRAFYINVDPGFPTGEYKVTVGDVPVDGFWSISVYNADGYFQANDRDAYSVNNITATPNDDGSITVTSVAAPTTDRTACRSWTAGTTPSACTDHDQRSSTAPGPFPLPNRPRRRSVDPRCCRLDDPAHDAHELRTAAESWRASPFDKFAGQPKPSVRRRGPRRGHRGPDAAR